jgi:hypothetical protein
VRQRDGTDFGIVSKMILVQNFEYCFMLKEIGIILAAIGCVFLIIPLLWIIGGALSFILPLTLLAIVLVYAGLDVRRLCRNKESSLAWYFLFFLLLAVVLSFAILYVLFPYVTPKLQI